MLIQDKLTNAAKSVISSSLATNAITDWNVYGNFDTDVIAPPLVKVICNKFEAIYPEVNCGVGRANLEVITVAMKAETDATEFETVSDIVFNPFFANNIGTILEANTTNIKVYGVYDKGLDVETLEDGWMATQLLEVVCSRLS
jgi:hypothetical protein